MYVLHRCDNPACCNPDHLWAGTQKENIDDMHRKGRYGRPAARGERHGRAKLTDEHVRQIRQLYREGRSQAAIGAEFGVGQSQVGRIVRGENRAA